MTDTELTIKQIVAKLTQDQKQPAELDLKDSLIMNIGLDSLTMIALTAEIEKTFGIEISDDDLLNQEEWMETIGSVIAFVEAKKEASH